ncbi:CotD family spore coat protein [Virgibacillus soli]|uniref:CotD family spore coat protein n=1 Tax=Paracerasibacillus soli TaxID=480284 RepID=A0ABU5CT40_9BACI|nr:CotD family spore coat protein [Virgibacillus soli]MDY0408989.1 CotD family spore coat protein [Virgibacillus soli]
MGFGRNNRNADEFILGSNASNRNNNSRGNNNDVETIVFPTETVIRPTTTRRTVRKIHPTHIVNVNRNITRVENFFPVTQSEKNKNIVEEYNCGSDVNNPRCRPVNNKRC